MTLESLDLEHPVKRGIKQWLQSKLNINDKHKREALSQIITKEIIKK